MKFSFELIKKEKDVIFYSAKQSLIKSKIIITQYVSIIAGLLQQYGPSVLSVFAENSAELQLLVDMKMFGAISVICAILTIYLKLTSKTLVGQPKE